MWNALAFAGRVGLLLVSASLVAHASAASKSGPSPAACIQAESLARLDAALVARLGAVPAPPVEEADRLEEALTSLRAYTGLLASYAALDEGDGQAVKADMERLVDVAGHVEASRTPDRNIAARMTAVRNTLGDFGIETRQVALGTFPLLADDVVVETLRALVARGEAQHEQGIALFGTLGGGPAGRNYLAGARKLALAWSSHHSAARQAEKQRIREGHENPVDIEPMAVEPPAEPPMSQIPFEVVATVQLTNPAPEVTVAVRAIPVDDPGVNPLPPQVTLGTKTFLDVPAGMQALPITVQIPPFADESAKTLAVEGFTVAVDGATAVVGRPNIRTAFTSGNRPSWASILERNAGGFGEWNEVARIEFTGIDDMLLGSSVAISGNTIVLGAPGVSGDRGAVFVFERLGGTWTPAASLAASDGAVGDLFGWSVAIDGDWIIVGAPEHNSGSGVFHPNDVPRGGTAYTFRRDAGGPGLWGQVDDLAQGLEAVNEVRGCFDRSRYFPGLESFGFSVAIHGGLALVGDPLGRTDFRSIPGFPCLPFRNDSERHGAAFAFQLVGGRWVPVPGVGWLANRPPFSPSDGPSPWIDSLTGSSVAIADQTLVVGAPDYSGFAVAEPRAGVVRVHGGAPDFPLVKTLDAPSPMADDGFGFSVAISRHASPNDPRQMIVVGSPGHDHPLVGDPQNAGSVYVFVRGHAPDCPPLPELGGWGLLARRVSEKPLGHAGFGTALAVTATTTVPGMGGLLQEIAPTSIFASDRLEGFFPSFQVMSGMEPVLAGEYWLELELDPHDRILEVQDSAPDQNVVRSPIPVTFCVPALDRPDLAVDSVQLVPIDPVTGDGWIAMETDDGEQLTRAGLNVAVRMAGSFDGPLAGATLRAHALGLPGRPSVSFRFWNQATGTSTGTYELSQVVPDLSSGDTLALHLDVQLDPVIGLASGSSHDMSIEVTIEAPPGVTEMMTDNNTKTQPGQDLRVFHFVSCNFTQEYKKQLGNDDFNATIDFMGSVALAPDLSKVQGHGLFPDNQAEFGAIGALSGGCDLTLMGTHLGRLVQFNALAERDPLQAYGFIGFNIQVRIPGTANHLETIYAIGPYDSDDLDGIPPSQLPPGFEVVNGGFRITRVFSISKSYERQKTFYPGGFPVTASGRAVGSLGVTLGMELTDRLKFDVIPFVDFSGGASFAAGPCDILCVGVDGEIVLVNDSFTMAAGVGMQIFDDGLGNSALGANACMDITNEITMLSGRINAFVVYPWFKWCRALGIPYPCGFYMRREEFPIVDWQGIVANQNILNVSENACCEQIEPGGFISCDANDDVVCNRP